MRKLFTQILIENYGVSEADLDQARQIKGEQQASLGDILVKRKVITDYQRLEALSILYDMPFLPELNFETINTDFTQDVSIQFLKKHHMVPLVNPLNGSKTAPADIPPDQEGSEGARYIIAVNDPTHYQPLDDLVRILQIADYQTVLAPQDAILALINMAYDQRRDSAEELVQNLEDDGSMIISEIEDTADLLDDSSDAPIIKLVNHILSQSIKARASDIHIEPYHLGEGWSFPTV